MEKIAFFGLGRIGIPLAARLTGSGAQVLGFDPDRDRCDRAGEAGIRIAPDDRTALATASVVVTALPGHPEIAEAFLGVGGWASLVNPGGLWIDLSSNSPDTTEAIDRALERRGVMSVAAPLLGGVQAAEQGNLIFLVAGTAAALARARPVLLAAAGARASIRLLGERPQLAQAAKLIINLLWFGQAAAVTEALLLARSWGLSSSAVQAVIADGPAASAFTENYLDTLLDGDVLPTFGLDRIVEELVVLDEQARHAGLHAPVSRAVLGLHNEALARFGPIDGELLVTRLLAERSGRPLDRGAS